jgi:leader peptidase (prepilin peptidase)/N-methyltransferase
MFELLADHGGGFVGLSLLLGLLFGSFLNVVIHRLPRMLEREWKAHCAWLDGKELAPSAPYDLVRPRSACPHCGHPIAWYENVPVASWLYLRGKCSACAAPISFRYPLVEAVTGVLFALAAWRWGFDPAVLAIWLLLASLVALTFIDLDTQLLPDNITLPLAWAGLLVNLEGRFVPLDQAVMGAVVGYLSLWSIYHLFRLLTGKEGMGFGDFKLLAALGAWMGWQMLLPIVLCASLAGALFGIGLVLFAGHDRARPLPFGPWLALGGVVTLFWGETLVKLWLG